MQFMSMSILGGGHMASEIKSFFSIFFEAGDLTRRNVGTMLISAAPPEKQELKLATTMVESSRLVPGVDRTTPRSF